MFFAQSQTSRPSFQAELARASACKEQEVIRIERPWLAPSGAGIGFQAERDHRGDIVAHRLAKFGFTLRHGVTKSL